MNRKKDGEKGKRKRYSIQRKGRQKTEWIKKMVGMWWRRIEKTKMRIKWGGVHEKEGELYNKKKVQKE